MTDIKFPPMPKAHTVVKPKNSEPFGLITTRDALNFAAEAVRLNAQADAKPMFWVRLRSDGCYEGPIHDSSIEDVRKQSGAWHPLYLAAPQSAQQSLTDEKEALDLLNAENDRLTKLVIELRAEVMRLNARATSDALEKELLQAIQERDAAEDYIDALLDEVLGTDRPEWSSTYGHADAIEQVREMMGALMKPCVDKAWGRFQSAQAAPAAPQPAQPLDLSVMELAESVGLIGPASRTHDLHEAIQRFHDLIVVNASIKAALHFADGLAQQPTGEKDALLRQALEALEGFANITNDSQGVKGYHLNGDIAEWDEFDEVDAASSTIEAIRTYLGVKND